MEFSYLKQWPKGLHILPDSNFPTGFVFDVQGIDIEIIIGLILKINTARWMFLYAHCLCLPTKLAFFLIPVIKMWHAPFNPKVHLAITGNWCTTDTTLKPPKPLHRTTSSYIEDCHASQ